MRLGKQHDSNAQKYMWLEGRYEELSQSLAEKKDSLKTKSQRVRDLEAENDLACVRESSEKSQAARLDTSLT